MAYVTPLQLYDEIKKHGWNSATALGMVGGILGEAELLQKNGQTYLNLGSVEKNPTHKQGNGKGLVQWTSPDRLKNFQQIIGKSPEQATLSEQVSFMQWELTTTHKGVGSLLKRSATVTDALTTFVKKFEIPKDADNEVVRRQKILNNVIQGTGLFANLYKGQQSLLSLGGIVTPPPKSTELGFFESTGLRIALAILGLIFLTVGIIKFKDF